MDHRETHHRRLKPRARSVLGGRAPTTGLITTIVQEALCPTPPRRGQALRGLRALSVVLVALTTACAGRAVSHPQATLPAGAQLLSAAALTAEWCRDGRSTDPCEDFRNVSIAEIVQFEQAFPALLKARGFLVEAEALPRLQRSYWGVVRERRLYVRGSLVCRDRLSADGSVILLIPLCPAIDVTFPVGHPQRVEVVFS